MNALLALTLALAAGQDAAAPAKPAADAPPAAPAPAAQAPAAAPAEQPAAAKPAGDKPAGPALPRRPIDRVAATVNGETITLRELQKRAGSALVQADALPPGPERNKARANAMQLSFEQIVSDMLFAAEAKNLGIEVSDADLDQQVAAIKQRNNFSEGQFAQALKSEGMDLAGFRERIRTQQINFEVLRYKIGGKVTVADEDVENYYRQHQAEYAGEDEVHVRHIFLPLAPGAPILEEARVQDQANRVLQRLKTGEDFAKVAKEVSRGPSADDGGDLGWLKRGTIQRDMEDVAFELKTGQFSEVIRFGPGLHILKVDERRQAAGKPYEQVKEDIRNLLLDQKGEVFRKQYVSELRRQAMIEVRIPELSANPPDVLAAP
ncbi:MAG: peptidylprolyl isomerase [Anaeromyxobacter sp.]